MVVIQTEKLQRRQVADFRFPFSNLTSLKYLYLFGNKQLHTLPYQLKAMFQQGVFYDECDEVLEDESQFQWVHYTKAAKAVK